MLLAGTDTSSVSMYYTLVAVAADPRVDERLYQELQQVLGNTHTHAAAFLSPLVFLYKLRILWGEA